MTGIFKALKYLHDDLNVIHRDIKPQNIVITDYDDLSKVKLIDFGLAVKSTKVQDFAKCGTLLYTPPE
jgi:serine/threonine protein kinase